MSLSTVTSSAPVFRSGEPPVSVIGWKQALRFRRTTKPRVISCDYSCIEVRDICYRPPGTELNILNGVNLSLREKSFGLIFGKSGSGKTTLLQLLAGLNKPTSGSICIQRYGDDGHPNAEPELLPTEKVGIVFQFPERFFVADNVLDEITFGWPRQKGSLQLKEHLTSNLQRAFNWVGLDSIPLDKDPQLLSGGYKRRLALAIQLVQTPDLLILDEPLAGLDWKARADVAKLLKHLKKELTLLVVSHDLRELATLVDQSWRMESGGVLVAERPPVSFDIHYSRRSIPGSAFTQVDDSGDQHQESYKILVGRSLSRSHQEQVGGPL